MAKHANEAQAQTNLTSEELSKNQLKNGPTWWKNIVSFIKQLNCIQSFFYM